MIRKKKTSKTKKKVTHKAVRQPNLSYRLVSWLFTIILRVLSALGKVIIRNPAVAGGMTAFFVVLGFVSANALWYQPKAHEDVFFKTRPDLVFKAMQPQTHAIDKIIKSQPVPPIILQHKTEELRFVHLAEMVMAGQKVSTERSSDIMQLQQKLASLGFYDGPIDGLPGPQTRKALDVWHEDQVKKMSIGTVATFVNIANEVSSHAVIPIVKQQQSSSNGIEQTTIIEHGSVSRRPAETAVTLEDIKHVQEGLKAFGNNFVRADGVPGKATQDAVREFQKLFQLQVTGQIDTELITKMREIGLLS